MIQIIDINSVCIIVLCLGRKGLWHYNKCSGYILEIAPPLSLSESLLCCSFLWEVIFKLIFNGNYTSSFPVKVLSLLHFSLGGIFLNSFLREITQSLSVRVLTLLPFALGGIFFNSFLMEITQALSLLESFLWLIDWLISFLWCSFLWEVIWRGKCYTH